MSTKQAQKRHEELVSEIRKHDHLYYDLAQPIISDADYDTLFRELQELEAKYPELVTPNSPTQKVAGKPLPTFKKVAHSIPMLSIETKEASKLITEIHNIIKTSENHVDTIRFVGEPKIDGLS